ncbi:AcrR family transcriptional regulator [Mycolicibacterium sp. BK556]|uniref:TetR/AcrR family transcriptional regulator n=1 Tax=Mycobacteriaceae TaxID=1762 RepID=UPI0010605DE6|nr:MULTISPECIES: TetR/AcrR family transcriptional regulator [Mycobacteriaceae]MBB3602624.1 AcrR family transcriptional regulator [Mycolicibacterium sp. BK556]MBB3632376.1 AcrR family transcriptional regulator [Mycolicibacterium sp. BK607]MBB3750411.1 AcrR family transcriptional regulator [Mycolicibacterium sp. BK634]TDO18335.1 TetR family transcriptional regulator [Mycobacterium sp. BK086]
MKHSGLLAKAVQRFGAPSAEGNAQRILDAALKQFELFGIRRSTVEDITRRSGLARVTLYRTFANKDAIVEAVLLRELERFLSELAAEAGGYPTAEDKLVEGFVFTLTTMRDHALLQRLLATEPETVLPFLTVEGDSVVQTASSFLAHQLAVALPDDKRTQIELLEVAEVTVRVIVSFVLTPSQNVALGDDDAARSFARRYLVPPLLGLTG